MVEFWEIEQVSCSQYLHFVQLNCLNEYCEYLIKRVIHDDLYYIISMHNFKIYIFFF